MTNPRYTSPDLSRQLYEAGVRCEGHIMEWSLCYDADGQPGSLGWVLSQIYPGDRSYGRRPAHHIGGLGWTVEHFPALDLHDLMAWLPNRISLIMRRYVDEDGDITCSAFVREDSRGPLSATIRRFDIPAEAAGAAILDAIRSGAIPCPEEGS